MYTKQINCSLCWYYYYYKSKIASAYLWHSRILRYPARWCRRIDFSWRPIWRLHIEACGQWIYKQQVRCLVKETHQLHCTDVPKKNAQALARSLIPVRPVASDEPQPFWVTQTKVVRLLCVPQLLLPAHANSSHFKRFWWLGGTPTIVKSLGASIFLGNPYDVGFWLY